MLELRKEIPAAAQVPQPEGPIRFGSACRRATRARDKITKPRASRLIESTRIVILAGFLFPVFHTTGSAQPYRVTGVDFRVDDDTVVITYDLQSEKRRPKWFTVRVLLLSSKGMVGQQPRILTGDAGRVRPGAGKSIRWSVLDDYPEGLDVREARFTVEATPSRTFAGRLPLSVRIGAAAVVASGLALGAVLIARGSPYPEPPPRPTF